MFGELNTVHRQHYIVHSCNNSCFKKDDPTCWPEEGLSRSAFKGRYFPLTNVVSQNLLAMERGECELQKRVQKQCEMCSSPAEDPFSPKTCAKNGAPPPLVSVTLSTTCARESQDLEEDGGTGRRREGGRDIVMEEGRPGGGAHPRPPKSRLWKCFCQNVKTYQKITGGQMNYLQVTL